MTKHISDYLKKYLRKRPWSSSHLVIWSSLLLSACGFQSMYGEHTGEAEAFLQGVQVNAPSSVIGQQFKHNLEDRLNPSGKIPANPAYRLDVSLESAVGGMGVGRDGTVSRYNVMLSSNYTLTRIADQQIVQRGVINHVSSYNNQVNQYFSTYVADRDSAERGVVELSELYRLRIGAYLMQGKPA